MDKYDKTVPTEYDGIFQKAADTYGVSVDLLRKMAWTESRFNPNAVSKTGPKGMMQFTKATAKAMGLRVDGAADDRLNPELAINAAAKHLSDLVGKFDGDELKAALAYNQGEGTLGNPQLTAYASGDFSKVSKEGLLYMKNLMDVAKSPMSGKLEAFAGITPKADHIPAEGELGAITRSTKVGDELPESTGFKVEGTHKETKANTFAKDFWESEHETIEDRESRSTFFGFADALSAELSNSTAGVAFRALSRDNGFDLFKDVITPTWWNSHVWTPEQLERIRNEVENPAYINVVLGGSPERLDDLIKLANENFRNDAKAADAGLGAKLTAGIIGAGVDPLSYVPLVGVAGKGLKLAKKVATVGSQSALLNVASEGLRTSVAGGEADYAGAALGGLMFGGGMTALSDGLAKVLRKKNPGVEYDNEFASAAIRMEAREKARSTDTTDLSRMNTENLKFDGEHNGVPFAEHPHESGAVVLNDGSIISADNPINPKTIQKFSEVDPERAAKGIRMGGFTEIGLKTLGSDVPEVRSIASDLVRSPTGMQSGASGKFGATASDIHERLHGTDQMTYNELYSAMHRAMQDPEWSTGAAKASREGARYEIYKRAALAIERPELQKGLTKGEREVMDIIKRHFDTKRELMENPAIFGNFNATSIFPGSRHKGTYVPNVYDKTAKALMVQRLGAEGLQEAIASSWLTSYASRAEVKARVDEYLKEALGVDVVTPEMVRKHAMDKAYGISHSDQFTASSVLEENLGGANPGLNGIENNSFLEARNLFDSDMQITLPDGSRFSVNDLRDFDMFRIMPAYDRRINGDIAIMGGTGKTTKELKEDILALRGRLEGSGKDVAEADALGDIVKMLTGRARRNQDTVLDTTLRSISDLGFFAKNAYMGAMNLTEIAGMLAKGNVRAMGHGIPLFRETLYKNKPVTAGELREIHNSLFGREVDQLIRPSRADIVQRLREYTDTSPAVANVVGTFKYGTQELAARSPWTKLLNGTSNYILDTARQGLLGNVVEAALTGSKSRWLDPRFLKSAAVTPEQADSVLSLIREHMVKGADGKFTIKDRKAFAHDPRAMTLWRLADRVADEAILRPHKVSLQDTKAYGAGVKMAMQFKTFTIKSLNSKFIRTFYEGTKNSRAIDAALTTILSSALAGGWYAMAAHAKAYGLPKEKRQEYLDKALDPTMIAHASVSRSSILGAPLSVADIMGGLFGVESSKMARSSMLPKDTSYKRDPNKPWSSAEVLGEMGTNILEQVPAAGFVANVGALGLNALGVATSSGRATQQDFMTGLMNASKEIVPNDPLTQQLIMMIYEANGVNLREKRK